MQALFVEQHGGVEALRFGDRPVPAIREDEVLLSVRAAALNHLDVWVRRGIEGHTFPLPMILGCDGAGVVEKVGGRVTHAKLGDRVAVSPGFAPRPTRETLAGDHHLNHDYGIFGETRDGLCAEYAAVPAANLLPMTGEMGFEEAAGFSLAALTAHHMLVRRAGVRPGQDVLIHAAGSGVSVMATQIAKLYGARVFATSTSADKLQKASELGADEVMHSADEDWVRRVKQLTGRRGVDIVIDHVGEATISRSLSCLARGGSVVSCGATSGPRLEADLRLIFFKSLSILGSTMGGMGEMREVWELHCRGLLRTVVDRTLPLSRAAQGHGALESREVFGKVVLIPGE